MDEKYLISNESEIAAIETLDNPALIRFFKAIHPPQAQANAKEAFKRKENKKIKFIQNVLTANNVNEKTFREALDQARGISIKNSKSTEATVKIKILNKEKFIEEIKALKGDKTKIKISNQIEIE